MPSGGYTRLAVSDPDLVEPTRRAPSSSAQHAELSAEERAGCCSRIFMRWASSVVETGWQKAQRKEALQMEDLGGLSKADRTELNSERFQAAWAQEEQRARCWDSYIGQRMTSDQGHTGYLRWVGRLMYSPNRHEYYAGVEWDLPDDTAAGHKGRLGRGDGWWMGEHMFDCAPGQGSFIKPYLIRPEGVHWSEPAPRAPSMTRALWRAFRWPLIISGFFRLFVAGTSFINPEVVRQIIKYLQKPVHDLCFGECSPSACGLTPIPEGNFSDLCYERCSSTCATEIPGLEYAHWGEGILWLCIMGFGNFFGAMGTAWYQFTQQRIGLQMRNVISAAVFEKSMNVADSASAHPDFNTGNKVNLIDKDSENVRQLLFNLHDVWAGPLLLVVSLIRLYTLVGPSVFAALGALFVIAPIQAFCMGMTAKPVREVAKAKDARIRRVNELFEGIRIVKYMVWEARFADEIADLRRQEIHWLKQQQQWFSGMIAGMLSLQPLMTATCFIVYSATGNDITPEIVFPAQGYFQIMQQPGQTLPQMLQRALTTRESFYRLSRLFESPDRVDYVERLDPQDGGGPDAVQIGGAVFGVHAALQLCRGVPSAAQLRPCPPDSLGVCGAVLAAAAAAETARQRVEGRGSAAAGAGNRTSTIQSPSLYVVQHSGEEETPNGTAPAPAAAGSKVAAGDDADEAKKDAEAKKVAINKDKEMYRILPKVVLRVDRMGIKRGKLTMIIGPTGCGKTSLLKALIGAIDLHRGRVAVDGSVAYVQQDAWLMNATLKDNVIFFNGGTVRSAEEEALYNAVVDACQLRSDIDQLDDGDRTEIGERGINLSGGQKQRVSLARAVYADRDIYLLDDPISALDAGTGREIMEQCVAGILRGKTVLLVTQQVQYLEHADEIIALDKDEAGEGRVVFGPGSYKAFTQSGITFGQQQHHAEQGAQDAGAAEGDEPDFVRQLSAALGQSPSAMVGEALEEGQLSRGNSLRLREESTVISERQQSSASARAIRAGLKRRQSSVHHHHAAGLPMHRLRLTGSAESPTPLWKLLRLQDGALTVSVGTHAALASPGVVRDAGVTHVLYAPRRPDDAPGEGLTAVPAGQQLRMVGFNALSALREAAAFIERAAKAPGSHVLVVGSTAADLVVGWLSLSRGMTYDGAAELIKRGGASEKPAAAAQLDQAEIESGSSDDEAPRVPGKPKELMRSEERKEGSVGLLVYRQYAQACGGYFKVGIALFLAACVQGGFSSTDLWLKYWSEHDFPPRRSLSDSSYEKIYMCIIAYVALMNLGNAFFSYARFREASIGLHRAIMEHLLKAPAYFFDTTPLGRILNRFTDDCFQMDAVVPMVAYFTIMFVCLAIGNIAVQATSQIYILPVFFFLGFFYLQVLRRYLPSQREMKRMDSMNRSPVIAHFAQAIGGQLVIDAYGVHDAFRRINIKQLNVSALSTFSSIYLPSWLSINLSFMSATIVIGLVGSNVIEKQSGVSMDAALAALGINYATFLPFVLNMLVNMYAQLEASMNAVERVVQYTSLNEPPDVPQEAPGGEDIPDPSWPREATIEFAAVSLRYREGLPLVVRGLNFRVRGGQKVGIVGQTGAGKSTIMVALFRFAELAEGVIRMGGRGEERDISQLRIPAVRRLFSMVPQDPVLFRGTVASNLDPFKEHTEAALWEALRRVNMHTRIEQHDGKLIGPVTEQGKNFSVGERQLLCLARAVLRKGSKVLLVDEATANIDRETDVVIQRTIRETFRDYTVLTIAHRLQTIIDSDKLIVLAKRRDGPDAPGFGYVAQDGTPKELIDQKEGVFMRSFIGKLPEAEQRRLEAIARADNPTEALLQSVEGAAREAAERGAEAALAE
eukprot:TRINITY_DN55036_c0_g1_i1.p1 TRINITY_DN55036_c0_g1~~TRINITY_DN55036_c0_g1_i1.p1  ORF type:complete len:1841 (+),score=628.53 TRINITY_DN55036_c0_g1_i1:98-5620(+)